MLQLWVTILLRAGSRDTKWRGITIEAGSFITSYSSLAQWSGLTVSEVRTALNKLLEAGSIARESTSRYQKITVVNWRKYQSERFTFASRAHTDDKPLTTNKNEIEIKEYTEDEKLRAALLAYSSLLNEEMETSASFWSRLFRELDALADTPQKKTAIVEQSRSKGWKWVYPLKTRVKKSTFHNFSQQEPDYQELEQKSLEKLKKRVEKRQQEGEKNEKDLSGMRT